MTQTHWLWSVRGIALALVAVAWLELRWTDEAIAVGVALVLSLLLAALFVGPQKRCLGAAAGMGLTALLLLPYTLYLSTGRDLGVLYFAPLVGLAVILAVCALRAGGRPSYGGYIAVIVLAGLWLGFLDIMDSEFRVDPELTASGTLRRVSAAQTTLAAGRPAGYAADLPAVAQFVKATPPKDPWDPALIQALLNSRNNRLVRNRYELVFRLTPGGGYEMTAQPEKKRWRSFFIDQTGVLRSCPRYCTASVKDNPI